MILVDDGHVDDLSDCSILLVIGMMFLLMELMFFMAKVMVLIVLIILLQRGDIEHHHSEMVVRMIDGVCLHHLVDLIAAAAHSRLLPACHTL